MRIFLVSLPNDFERRERLKRQFPKYYDNFTMIEAVDGRKLTSKDYFDLILCSYSRSFMLMTPGEVGCALSHMKVYEYLIQSGEEYALVLEDDVIGDDSDIEKIQNLVPKILDIYGENFVWLVGGMEGLPTKHIYLKETRVPGVCVIHSLSRKYVCRTVCYVVTKLVAGKILENQRRCLTIADDWDTILPKETVMLYSGILKHPSKQESVIESERTRAKLNKWRIIYTIMREALQKRCQWILLRFTPVVGYKRLS